MSHVFPRVFDRQLPTAVAAEGAWITDADGKRYIDGAGGAVVVNIGHGDRSLVEAASAQLTKTQYVHGTAFSTEALEAYADFEAKRFAAGLDGGPRRGRFTVPKKDGALGDVVV